MKIHLIDGTYELFRNYYGAPKKQSPDGREVGATLGLLRSLASLLARPETTHVACAFDHVIESFRNTLYSDYKTSEGIEPELFSQFHLAEDAVSALGVVMWPMIEFEADDALAAATEKFKNAKGVEQVIICTPDKDMAQLVEGNKVVCWDRRRDIVYDEPGVVKKFGVAPASIPDWLALVGDTADGYPGIQGWGEKSASAVLSRFGHLESIPKDCTKWDVKVSRAQFLSDNLEKHRDEALLYRRLATLRKDVPLAEELDDLKWKGARADFAQFCAALEEKELPERVAGIHA